MKSSTHTPSLICQQPHTNLTQSFTFRSAKEVKEVKKKKKKKKSKKRPREESLKIVFDEEEQSAQLGHVDDSEAGLVLTVDTAGFTLSPQNPMQTVENLEDQMTRRASDDPLIIIRRTQQAVTCCEFAVYQTLEEGTSLFAAGLLFNCDSFSPVRDPVTDPPDASRLQSRQKSIKRSRTIGAGIATETKVLLRRFQAEQQAHWSQDELTEFEFHFHYDGSTTFLPPPPDQAQQASFESLAESATNSDESGTKKLTDYLEYHEDETWHQDCGYDGFPATASYDDKAVPGMQCPGWDAFQGFHCDKGFAPESPAAAAEFRATARRIVALLAA